jgi:hypothetical protein
MQKHYVRDHLKRALIAGMVTLWATSVLPAQNAAHYVGLNYLKTLPGKAEAFRKFAETDMVKMGQMGVDDGNLDAYYVLRLTAPYTAGSDYDYIQAVWYKKQPSLAPLDRKVWEERARKAGYASYQQYLDKRDSMAKVVRAAWRTAPMRIGDMKTGNYMRTVTYQVDREFRTDVARFYREYTMPLAQGRINDSRIVGWGMTVPAAVVTSEDEAGFSMSVSNTFKDSDTLMSGPAAPSEEAFKKALPGKSYTTYTSELARLLTAHSKVVTTRISEVVAMAGTPPKITPPTP